jgi:hypothetical protein
VGCGVVWLLSVLSFNFAQFREDFYADTPIRPRADTASLLWLRLRRPAVSGETRLGLGGALLATPAASEGDPQEGR